MIKNVNSNNSKMQENHKNTTEYFAIYHYIVVIEIVCCGNSDAKMQLFL